MKIQLSIDSKEELGREIKDLIRGELKSMVRGEFKKIISDEIARILTDRINVLGDEYALSKDVKNAVDRVLQDSSIKEISNRSAEWLKYKLYSDKRDEFIKIIDTDISELLTDDFIISKINTAIDYKIKSLKMFKK